MTFRKGSGVPWESWVDRQVREAEERGEFEALPGAGKPIPGASEPYDPDWWLKKFTAREGLMVLPRGLALRRYVEQELSRIRAMPNLAVARHALTQLNRHIREENARVITGPPSNVTEVTEAQLDWSPEPNAAGETPASAASKPESPARRSQGGRFWPWLCSLFRR